MKIIISLFLTCLLLSACSNNGRYQYANDHAPSETPPLDHIEDVIPRYEPYSRGGNKDYTVRGIHYKVERDITKLTQKGGASWYGNKFHGHLTSNGERYNMFAMSAAHKTLPLPSYVQVTNLANNKKIIVRVNDRGPFHEGRVIDLSYAAASKLDMLQAGTAQVEVKLLHFNKDKQSNVTTGTHKEISNGNFNIQYLVSSSSEKAVLFSEKLAKQHQIPGFFTQKNKLYYLRLGPFANALQAEEVLEKVKKDYPQAYILPITSN